MLQTSHLGIVRLKYLLEFDLGLEKAQSFLLALEFVFQVCDSDVTLQLLLFQIEPETFRHVFQTLSQLLYVLIFLSYRFHCLLFYSLGENLQIIEFSLLCYKFLYLKLGSGLVLSQQLILLILKNIVLEILSLLLLISFLSFLDIHKRFCS